MRLLLFPSRLAVHNLRHRIGWTRNVAIRTPSPLLFQPGVTMAVLAWLLVIAGCLVILSALLVLRFRAAAPSIGDDLVERGPYSFVRHPIYSGMLLELVGLVLWSPTPIVALACALCAGWVSLQARLEELDLLQRMPAYRKYMERLPRFCPRMGSKPSAGG